MCTKSLILILLISLNISLICRAESSHGTQGTLEDRIKRMLSDWKTENDRKLEELKKNLSSKLGEILNNKLNAMDCLEKKILKEIYEEKLGTHCKERVTNGIHMDPLIWIDKESFNHVTLERSNGDTHFEMHVAIKAARNALILLSPLNSPYYLIVVGADNNEATKLRLGSETPFQIVQSTPDILSSSHYTPFYIKITKGKLEFGKEGGSPIISYQDGHVNSIKYFGFGTWDKNEAKVLYDCPVTETVVCARTIL